MQTSREEIQTRIEDIYALNASVRAGQHARRLQRANPPAKRRRVRWLFDATRRRFVGVATASFPRW